MEAFLIDLSNISLLLSGQSPDTENIVEQIRSKYPSAWEIDPDYDEASEGQALESLLTTGKWTGSANLAGRALILLIRQFGEKLNSESLDDASFMFLAAVMPDIPTEDYFCCRPPAPLEDWGGDFPIVGYLTPQEAAETLDVWPEPDFDDPEPEIYAAREQIEDWLQKSRDSQTTLIMFWE